MSVETVELSQVTCDMTRKAEENSSSPPMMMRMRGAGERSPQNTHKKIKAHKRFKADHVTRVTRPELQKSVERLQIRVKAWLGKRAQL
jgi:hypothetical protein